MMASVAEYFDVLLHTALQSTLPAEAHYVAKTRWHPLLAAGRLKLDVVLVRT